MEASGGTALTVTRPRRRVRPGWYLLAALAFYALVTTLMLGGARSALDAERSRSQQLRAQLEERSRELTWPLVGASPPASNDNLPGAARAYRKGVSQGFVFTGSDAGVPVVYGTPVVAAGDGRVSRADLQYRELTPADYAALLARVKGGAAEPDLDRLRGRQVWIVHPDGTTTRYGHLAHLAHGVAEGQDVRRGQVIAYVGNSGTAEATEGKTSNARLLFEVWREQRFLGDGLKGSELREQAGQLIKPWP
ncbi:MAG TPA: M23 family metallopeptidase [Deinococcales bacterium]|nr:M23 family metallopeptidase [Deinococcales bacterium]